MLALTPRVTGYCASRRRRRTHSSGPYFAARSSGGAIGQRGGEGGDGTLPSLPLWGEVLECRICGKSGSLPGFGGDDQLPHRGF
jgi:hypothetical protein